MGIFNKSAPDTIDTPASTPGGIFSGVKAGPSTPLLPTGPSKAKATVDSILKGVKITAQSKIPTPKAGIDPNNIFGNNDYDPSSTSGIIKNTIKGLPKAVVDFNLPKKAIDFITGAGQSVMRSGLDTLYTPVQAGFNKGINAVNKVTGSKILPLPDEIKPNGNDLFSNISAGLIGKGESVKTIPKSISDTQKSFDSFLSQDKEISVAGKKIKIPGLSLKTSDAVSRITAGPAVIGGILLDLTGWGGEKKVASFAEKNVPESFFKYVAKEESALALKQTLNKIGLTDEVASTRLAGELALTKTPQEAKTALLAFENEQKAISSIPKPNEATAGNNAPKSGIFSSLEKTGPVDNVVDKGITKTKAEIDAMTDPEFNAFIKSPEGINYAKQTEANIPDQSKDHLFGDINKSTQVDNQLTMKNGMVDNTPQPKAAIRPASSQEKSFNMTVEEAHQAIAQMFDKQELELKLGSVDDIFEMSNFDDTAFAKDLRGIYKPRSFAADLIGLVENDGKAEGLTLYHESGHAFIERYVKPSEKRELLDFVKKNILTRLETEVMAQLGPYNKNFYETTDARAEEWLVDDFARYAEEIRLGQTPTQTDGKLVAFYKKWLAKIRSWIRTRGDLESFYKRILNKDRSHVNSKVRKISVGRLGGKQLESKLPPELERMQLAIEMKEEALNNSPLNKLVKYQSSARPGELPELNDALTKGKGIFNQKGDTIIDEVMGYKYDYRDQQDVNDVRDLFEKFMEDKKKLTQMKRDFQNKRIDFIRTVKTADKNPTISKNQTVQNNLTPQDNLNKSDQKSLNSFLNKTQTAANKEDKAIKPFRNIDELINSGKARVIFRDGRDIYQFKQKNDWISTRDESSLVNRFNQGFKDVSSERNLPDSLDQRREAINLQKRYMRENPLKAVSSERMRMLRDDEIQLQKDIKTYKDNADAEFLASSKRPPVVQPREGSEGELRSLEIAGQEIRDTIDPKNYGSVDSFDKIISQTQTSVKDKVNVLDFFRTPDRVLKKIGFGREAEAARLAYDEYAKELPKNIDMISHWSKQVSKESNVRIFKYLDGKPIDLTPKEKDVALEVRLWLQEWAKRLNLPEDNTITHYITHIFDAELVGKEFDEDLAKIIADKVPGQVYDPFLQKRLGAKGYKQDTWAALDAYVKRATRKVHMDPVLEKIKEKAGGTLETSNIEKSQFNYVKNYVEGLNMRPTVLDEYFDNAVKSIPGIGYKLGQRPVIAVTRMLRRLTYRGMLGLNPGSALRNLSQGVNTYAVLGEKNTIKGYIKLFQPNSYKELAEEGVLDSGFIQDRVLSATRKLAQRTDRGLFVFFETAEKINRGSAYFGGKAKYWSNNKIQNKSETGARQYAKEIVRKTQFAFDAVDTPVALQGDIAKTLFQFQTFPIKQVEFLQELAKNKNYAGLVRYLVASLVFVYTVGQAFGMKPADIIPSIRFGTPPSLKFPTEVIKAGLNTPDSYGKTRDLKTKGQDIFKSAVGLFPAGNQIKKTIEAIKANQESGVYDDAGRRMFKAGTTKGNTIQNIIFGKYSTAEAQDYFKTLSGSKKDDKYKDIQGIYDQNQKLKADGKTAEAETNYNFLSPANKSLYTEYKNLQNQDQTSILKKDVYKIYDANQKLKADGKKVEAETNYNNLPEAQKQVYQTIKKADETKSSQQSETGFIGKIVAYAEAIGTDPVTAYNLVMAGEKIRRVDNGAIIVERMALKDSEAVKKKLNGNTPDFKLDHTIPLELGGTNDESNLKLVSTDLWKSYSPIENYLGNLLATKKLTKAQVLEAIKRFKNGEITAEEVKKLYN